MDRERQAERARKRNRHMHIECARESDGGLCVRGGGGQREKRIYKYSKDENSELYVDMAMVQQKLNK